MIREADGPLRCLVIFARPTGGSGQGWIRVGGLHTSNGVERERRSGVELQVHRRAGRSVIELEGRPISLPSDADVLFVQRLEGGFDRYELDLSALDPIEILDELPTERARASWRAIQDRAFATWGKVGSWSNSHERTWNSLEAMRAGEPPTIDREEPR